jgi:UMF1 family MFS transporter
MDTTAPGRDEWLTPSAPQRAPRRALAGWTLVEWAQQPFYALILTFLFAPYFTTAVASDPVHGQALWGYAAAIAGICIAIVSPVLGAVADSRGRRKPWVALAAAILAVCMTSLWWATPGAGAWTIFWILVAFIIAQTASELISVFANSIMPSLVPRSELGRLSGIGWAMGFTGGLVALVIMAGFLVPNPATGNTLLGLAPLFPLDLESRQGDRLVGPFSAIWLIIFIIPFFLFVPDPKIRRTGIGANPLAELWQTVKSLPSNRDMLLFLVARAVYTDGLTAIFVFGGIYGTSVFDWQPFERGMFGIILTVAGVLGAVAGGFLDDRLGSKRVLLGSLVILLVAALGVLSVSSGHVLFWLPVEAKVAGNEPFASTGERVFLCFGMLIAVVAAPLGASSRALLARLAPPEQMTQYFGLFAFSGKATAFAAPLLVALATNATSSQRLGMATILLFIVAGFLLLLPVRATHRQP